MSIRIEDIDSLDFTDVADTAGVRLDPVAPGEILQWDFLQPMAISPAALAQAIAVSALVVSELISGSRAITAETDGRLSRFFGLHVGFWLELQRDFDSACSRGQGD